jgi:hypothetical protein
MRQRDFRLTVKMACRSQEGQTMNLTAWVDVAIGLCLVYLGASLFVTVINEYLSQAMNLRGKQLCESLKTLIDDANVKGILMKSPVIKPFFDSDSRKAPSYIDPNVLAHLLVGGLATGSAIGNTVQQVRESVERLPDSSLKTQLQAIVRSAGISTDALVAAVSSWADRSLTILGEGYKRHLQKISFLIGLVVAIGFNLDTVTLTEHLYRDKNAREAAVALGMQIAEGIDKAVFDKCLALTPQKRKEDASCVALTGLIEVVQSRNETLGKLPIGWPLSESPAHVNPSGSIWAWITRVVGWLLSALALSLGAPFWFDLLNKLINMRHGIRRPEVKEAK